MNPRVFRHVQECLGVCKSKFGPMDLAQWAFERGARTTHHPSDV